MKKIINLHEYAKMMEEERVWLDRTNSVGQEIMKIVREAFFFFVFNNNST